MFQTNQKVVCINDSWPAWALSLYSQLPKKGEVYTVRDVLIARTMPDTPKRLEDGRVDMRGGEPEVAITLQELRNSPDPFHTDKGELAFNANRFRAIENIDEEIEVEEYAEL